MPLLSGHDDSILANATAHAIVLHERGMLGEAEKAYLAVLQARPDHFDALHLLGVLRQQQGNSAEAMRLIGAALELAPQSVEALCNFGAVLNALKRHEEALAAFERAIAIAPGHPGVLNYCGNTLLQLNRLEEALAAFEGTLAVNRNDITALISHGNALLMLSRPEEALASFESALRIQPDHAAALSNCGLALTQLHRHEEALDRYRKAIETAPDRVSALNNYCNSLLALGRAAEALASLDDALASYEKARALDHMAARNMLAICRLAIADWAQAQTLAEEVKADLAAGHSGNPLAVTAFGFGPAAQLQAAKGHARILVPTPPKPFVYSNAMRSDKLRVAYVTTAFREHPVAVSIVNLLERHDRERFEIIGIALGRGDTSSLRARMIDAIDRFHQVGHETDRSIAKLINDLDVHIAVDLNGWTD